MNLDPKFYGTLAEIGAGQEVARWFFAVGGAAGTIAKTISAYDMTISDTFYGKCARYVTKERLEAMLEYEYLQCELPLKADRGKNTCFFAFADTVVAKAYLRDNECHGTDDINETNNFTPFLQALTNELSADRIE
eukprot:gene16088-19083_t